MKTHNLANYAAAILVVLSGLGLGIGLASIGTAKRSTAVAPRTEKSKPTDTRTLKEKAKKSKQHVEYKRPERASIYSDLGALNRASIAVIIGIPEDNVSNLSADGKSVNIDYKVRVKYVYKGRVQQDSTITVSLPGGRKSFDDGSTVEVRTPWFKKMQHGRAYALFLNEGERNGSFITTGDAQGVFEIPMTKDNQVVTVHSGLPGDAIRKYHNADVRTFLIELRRVTGKKLKE